MGLAKTIWSIIVLVIILIAVYFMWQFYKQSMNSATGRLLAASNYFSSMSASVRLMNSRSIATTYLDLPPKIN